MKKIIRLGLMSLMMVLMAGIVHGAPTCAFNLVATTVGTASSYIRGTTQKLNVTITSGGVGEGTNVTTCKITSTGTITGSVTFNTSYGTNNSYCNTTVNTEALVDTSSYTFTMTMYNESQISIGTACTRVFIPDNTKPTYSSYSPSDGSSDSDGSVDFSTTCSNTSSATLYLESTPYTMTESSDVCTATVSNLRNSLYSWYVSGTDGLNVTSSTTNKVEIRKSGGVTYVDGQPSVGASQLTTQPSTGIKGLLNDLIQLPIKLLNMIIGAIASIFN